MARANRFVGFVDVKLHLIEFAQQVVGEFDVGLVDFIDQQNDRFGRDEGLPEHALFDVVADILDLFVTELRIAQPRDRVVFVEALVCLGGGLDVPLQERASERAGNFLGQHGLAGTGLPLDQQRAQKGERGIDGELEIVSGNIAVGAVKALGVSGSGGGVGH